MDIEKLAQDIGINATTYKALLEMFVKDTFRSLITIKKALKTDDHELISFEIHLIKGAALNLSLDNIVEIIELDEIETLIKKCEIELHDMEVECEKNTM